MIYLLLTIVFVAIGVYVVKNTSKKETSETEQQQPIHFELLNDNGDPFPEKLLDLHTTTVAERQRAYGRSFQKQILCDEIQRQAEELKDTDTLESLRTNSYHGQMPIKKPDGTYTNYLHQINEYDIAGIMYRNKNELRKCTGIFNARLVAEPDNEFDSNAIKIVHEANIHVGYIPRECTDEVRSIVTLPALCFAQIWADPDGEYFSGTVYIEKEI